MKLPEKLTNFFKKKSPKEELFLSLTFEAKAVTGAVWSVGKQGKPQILATSHAALEEDSWDARLDASDKTIGTLEETVGSDSLEKVVLGLPSDYLTPEGDIAKDIREHIKNLTHELALRPIGFVPLHQAIVHKLKVDEGVPPSIILLQVLSHSILLSLYKVGALVGQKKLSLNNVVKDLEEELKGFKDLEVLPSRILLVGTKKEPLEEIKNSLLKYPWPTRANFLHFPKIEVLKDDFTVGAVSFAGASELSTSFGEEVEDESVPAEEVVDSKIADSDTDFQKDSSDNDHGLTVKENENEDLDKEDDEDALSEEPNVIEVGADELGFGNENVNNRVSNLSESDDEGEEERNEEDEKVTASKSKFSLPQLALPAVSIKSLIQRFKHIPKKGKVVPILIVIILVCIILASFSWFLPKASVTVYELPYILEDRIQVVIDPEIDTVNAETNRLPGRELSHVVSGEKTIPVTGKKQVGDPAKGAVTIYNKATSSRSFKKGSQLVSGSLTFTLDDDVLVASASESIGSITFGKSNVSVTASNIGTQSNLPSGTEFTFKDVSSSIAIARNDTAFAGGTSRNVTVVTRADYDALVSELTDELVAQAKNDLLQKVDGGQILLTDTLSSTVSDRTFSQELNQEANELKGNISITITGIAYSRDDLLSLIAGIAEQKIPDNYTFEKDKTTMEVASSEVKKDGSITADLSYKAFGLPQLDSVDIKKSITGKKISEVQDYLKGIPGIGGVEFRFRWSLSKSRLPSNTNNISLTFTVQE